MAILATGQFTVVDMYDVPALNVWITASQGASQIYNNTAASWSPHYPSAPQVLTLNITKAGATQSLLGSAVTGVKWYKMVGTTKTLIDTTSTSANEYIGGTANSVLTSKLNIPIENNAVTFSVEGIWKDPVSKIEVAFGTTIALTLVQLAKAAIIGSMYAPKGDFFKNDTPSSLTINCDLYKDGVLSLGKKLVKWFASDSSVNSEGHASFDADGGIGWRKITATAGPTGEVANIAFGGELTLLQAVLTVYPNAVTNAQTFLCVIKDNEGGTAGVTVKNYLTLRDMDDPVMAVIESTGGDVFKNGIGSTTLKARLYRNGAELDAAGSQYTYRWYKWENNAMVPGFGGAGVDYKTGKELPVGGNDVNVTTTFRVEVIN